MERAPHRTNPHMQETKKNTDKIPMPTTRETAMRFPAGNAGVSKFPGYSNGVPPTGKNRTLCLIYHYTGTRA